MVDNTKLVATVKDMIGPGKVIMAMDESTGTMNRRLVAVGLEPTEENRHAWRELIVTTPDLTGVGAAILCEETVFQKVNDKPVYQILTERGIVPGVKLDKGKEPTIGPYNESNTKGLDDLSERLEKYKGTVKFAKWRLEFIIGDNTPTDEAIHSNVYGLAVYAHLCQKAGIVPIVEPEILIKGNHDIDRSYKESRRVLSDVFKKLDEMNIYLEGTILKPSMVTPGDKCRVASPEEVAQATIDCFLDKNLIPSDLGGISHLSGGLTDLDAVLYLNALNSQKNRARASWRITASYGRAEIGEGLVEWHGNPSRVGSAQAIIAERTNACGLASEGKLPANFQYRLTANDG